MDNKKALLVVSFGSTYLDTVEAAIVPVEKAIAKAFPDRKFYRAFGSKFVVKKLRDRNLLPVQTTEEALGQIAADGYTDLLVQPTFIIPGTEYDWLMDAVRAASHLFASVQIGTPLLNHPNDYKDLIAYLADRYPQDSPEEAVVLMGHGSEHFANAAYPALEHMLHNAGQKHIFVATVEGYPELGSVIRSLENMQAKQIMLVPLMLVAGDHARNDMAGEEPDSWKNQLEEKGMTVSCILKGLGEEPVIQEMFAFHARTVFDFQQEDE